MRVGNSTEFEKLLEAVAADAFQALDHRNLSKDLMGAREEYHREFSQTPTFWWLTDRAHAEAVLYRLTRLYDQRDDSLSLRTWLKLVSENVHLFDERNFRQRLKDNPFVKGLAQDARRPDREQLELDKKSVEKNDPVVGKLVSFRNTSLAHRDPTTVLGGAVTNEGQLTWADVDTLIERAITIINRYSYLFRASSYACKIMGHDDYKFLLRMVRDWLLENEARFEEEMRGRN